MEVSPMKKVLLTVLVACLLTSQAMAQTTTPPPPATTAGNVWRVTYLDVLPGKTTEYMTFLRTHIKPMLDEQKKQGLILDYKFFSQPITDGPGDWDVVQVTVYRNYADAIDSNPERSAKFDAISIGHYGSVEERTKAGDLQSGLRTVVSSRLVREQTLNPMTK
jgi:hypothetical protein